VVGALATARVLESQLWGIAPRDPVTLGVGAMMVTATTIAACYVPARRTSSRLLLNTSPDTAATYGRISDTLREQTLNNLRFTAPIVSSDPLRQLAAGTLMAQG
jgi:hypothetical protein